jgi:hypothetical protein
MKISCKIFWSVLFLATSVTGLYAQAPAGFGRPANVPANYVITPAGYFHPSCVRQLGRGESLLADGRVLQHADGTLENIPACEFPHYTSRGEVITPGAQPPTIGHSWIEDSNVTTSSSYGEITATWAVPPSPTGNDSQTVYFFPGLEDINDIVSIIQPVLGWNADYKDAWGIASWNCCVSGTTWESSPVRVNSSDTILGTVRSTCSPGVLTCPTWNITTNDVTLGKSTTLSNSPNEGQTFNWAFAGALEVYNIVNCNDYPANGSINFYAVALYDYNFNQISSPAWSIGSYYSGLTPQCSYGGSVASTSATLNYGFTGSVSPGSINFGQHFMGDPPVFRTVTLTNNGSSTMTITSIGANLADPFLVSSKTCGSTLGAKASCTITVEFDTTNAPNGTSSQTMSIVDSAVNSPQGVPLTGKMSCPGGQCL